MQPKKRSNPLLDEEKEKKSKIVDWLTRYKFLPEKDWKEKMENVSGRGNYTYASGGLTRTVAPDSGPMHQGLRSLYINDKDY